MLRRLRAVLILSVLVAALAWGANAFMRQVVSAWVDRDETQRATLVVRASGAALADLWRNGDTLRVHQMLTDVAGDDRILGAATCGPGGSPPVRTERFPAHFRCDTTSPDVTALPLSETDSSAGFILLLHDPRFLRLRIAQMRTVVFGGFALVGLLALLGMVFDRWSVHQSWARELRGLFGAFSQAHDPLTMLAEIRTLAERAMVARSAREDERIWTPERLRDLVHESLEDAELLLLANREPIIHERDDAGAIHIIRPASGLVSALEPVMRACSGTWIAHGAGAADTVAVDAHDRFEVCSADGSYCLRRVWLNPGEEAGYYYGLANEGLWPLCHIAHARPTFRAADMRHYRIVNQRFADAACQEATRNDPVVLVQDYHFALAPRMIRDRLPDATILAFWHIPWPNAERFAICPWRSELIEGLLGASILGFHTQQHCNNFLEAVDTFIEARVDRERQAIIFRGRQTLVRPYPISVEWPLHWADAAPGAGACRVDIQTRHGLSPNTVIGVGIDRLDYTKGIEERFLAVERLLEDEPALRGRVTFIQLAAPSRTAIPRYAEYATEIGRTVERINRRFEGAGGPAILLLHQHHDHSALARYYRGADFCYVSSLHDGMNLVAKEFVATRSDEQGVLLLSSFTGAARELTEAIIVNPYDIDGASAAMSAAIRMSADEQRERMRAMRTVVRDANVFRWAGRMLTDAAHERQRVRLAGRLSRLPMSAR